MIACEAVSVVLATGVALVSEVSLTCAPGEIVILVGASGSGKSTLLSVVAGLRRPTSGQVVVDGQPVSRFTAHHRDLHRRRTGVLPQHLHLFEELSALENVLLPTLPLSPDPARSSRARALLEELELGRVGARPVRTLSGGEQQRVAFARALVLAPPMLLLDEPTAHQDDFRAGALVRRIEREAARGAAVLVAAHDPRLVAALPRARRYEMRAGRLSESAE